MKGAAKLENLPGLAAHRNSFGIEVSPGDRGACVLWPGTDAAAHIPPASWSTSRGGWPMPCLRSASNSRGPMAGSPASRVEVSSGQGVNVDDPVGALQKLIGRVQFEPIDPE